jgi:hypothetical protein
MLLILKFIVTSLTEKYEFYFDRDHDDSLNFIASLVELVASSQVLGIKPCACGK